VPPRVAYVRELLANEAVGHRKELAVRVCEQFGFYDPRGRVQVGGCLKALRELERAGHFRLPPPQVRPGPRQPRRLGNALPAPEAVPAQAGQVQALALILVDSPRLAQIWNELLQAEHPQGAGPLVGRQLRYLIGSAHGWLGAVGFAAPALQLAARDAWIGWDAESRRAHLDGIVGMARFLIRPSVRCHNLASKVLCMSLAALPRDFEQQYGYRPWLVESFVDRSAHAGTCYQAANWIKVGQTKGRGRQDRSNRCAKSIKDIYVYPLQEDFRASVGLAPEAGGGALAPAAGLDGPQWAQHEFGGAPLGDARLSRRLVKVAAAKAQAPDLAFTGVAKGDWPAVKAYYRFIDQPDQASEADPAPGVTMTNILRPHRDRTVRRMMAQDTVLCVQDGTDLDYNNLDRCDGLGVIGTNQTGAQSRGLHLHTTVALAPNGLPLGVVQADCDAPAARADKGARLEQKKTFQWIKHHRALVELAAQMPNTRLINVCDREADLFELFDEQRSSGRVHLLVRAKHDRIVKTAVAAQVAPMQGPLSAGDSPAALGKLFAAAGQAPMLGKVAVAIGRQSARPKRSKQKARPKRAARLAELTMRAATVWLQPPREHADKAPIELRVVHAREDDPPPEREAVQWLLLTTLPVATAEQAQQCLRCYCLRWRIEDWHRVIKTGCRIEDLAHESAERLRRAIAINLVVGWRIMLMTLLGRETPQLPAEVLFTDIEVQLLQAFAEQNGLPPPARLGSAVRLVAKLGGYIGRNTDPPPGHQILWQGFTALQLMTLGASLYIERQKHRPQLE
jgi:Druantia protein DruA/Transposase DNA-binding/Transposase Tn5 dimerisation domain